MALGDLISIDAVAAEVKAGSKKQLLQQAACRAAGLTNLPEAEILSRLMARERLGSTGVGAGVAIPHAKLPELDRIVGLFLQLAAPVAFDAVDDQPVDLVFILLAPEGAGVDHLKTLARVSRLLRDKAFQTRLRGAKGSDAIYALLAQDQADAA